MAVKYLNDLTKNAMGGTELMARALESRLDPRLMDKIDIIPSRVRDLDPNKINILWLHDLPSDPESNHLANGGYNRFERIVFVSNWQMQQYIQYYGIPWYKCAVIENAIEPFEPVEKPNDKINIIYHTTPHRGLNILVPVFAKLAEKHTNIHLDVYSSFKIYGWPQRDEQYQALFKQIEDHPNMTYHGSVPNEQIREALGKAHIFAYPSIWMETSCIAMIEAMAAGLLCVHPNLAALPETTARWTWMYQYQEDQRDHGTVFFNVLAGAIELLRTQAIESRLANQARYANMMFSWQNRIHHWDSFLNGVLMKKGIRL